MQKDNRPAPEVDVLDQLCGGPMSLATALSIFPDLERARRALSFLAAETKVEFVGLEGGDERVLQQWQIRQLLDSLGQATPEYVQLRLTTAGYESFVRDSRGFFDKLFAR